MYRLLVTGPAGSGKGTICRMLLKEYENFNYFSAGDVIRDHVKRGTDFGQRVASFIKKGELIPDSLLNDLLLQRVVQAGNKVILDGYPRSLHQVKLVEEVAPINLVVELKVPKKVLIDRMSKQLVHPGSGRTYNLDFNPPKLEGKDDITGELLVKREDDASEIVRRRLEVHEKTEAKVLDYYKDKGLCLSVAGDTSTNVVSQICEAMNEQLKKKRFG
ncbi:unnamed protein product [Auanema sp. JU1783]|nr:unnamed protein product [Auanema sp. JU1783]